MRYHLLAFAIGMGIDALIGDPPWLPHPVRWIGALIAFLEKKLLRERDADRGAGAQKRAGVLLAILVILITGICTAAPVAAAYLLSPAAGVAVEAVLTAYTLAARDLSSHSLRVYSGLAAHDLHAARKAVGDIVGRDTSVLDEAGIIRAAVESVAENTTDGVIAPMIFDAIGGPALGMIYKSINTMDSMVGYKTEEYENFGWFPARLDDAVNFIPARITALLMIGSTWIMGVEYNTSKAAGIYRRDRNKSESPNAGQTESVVAGALGIALAGDATYFGRKKSRLVIGDADREAEPEDIKRANKLMETTAVFCMLICVGVMINL